MSWNLRLWQCWTQAGQEILPLFLIPHLTKGEGNPRKGEIPSFTCSSLYRPWGIISLQERTPDLELTGSPERRESHHALDFPKQQDALEPHSFNPSFGLEGPGPRTRTRPQAQPLASQLQEPRPLQRPGKERGVPREAPPPTVTWGRDRKRDGVRGGGAVAARGRGGGARRSVLRLGRERREAGKAAGCAALNLIDRATPRADGLTGGRRRRESGAASGDAEDERVRLCGRHSVSALNEAPAPLSPEPGAFPARWTVSPAASVSPAAGSRPSCVTRDPGFLRARRGPCSPTAPPGGRRFPHMVPARLQPRRRLRDGRPLPHAALASRPSFLPRAPFSAGALLPLGDP